MMKKKDRSRSPKWKQNLQKRGRPGAHVSGAGPGTPEIVCHSGIEREGLSAPPSSDDGEFQGQAPTPQLRTRALSTPDDNTLRGVMWTPQTELEKGTWTFFCCGTFQERWKSIPCPWTCRERGGEVSFFILFTCSLRIIRRCSTRGITPQIPRKVVWLWI